jgi:hypothetical protein
MKYQRASALSFHVMMKIMKLTCIVAIAATLITASSAQVDLKGQRRYPQFRGLSGLPGGGYGVLPDGKLSITGAVAFTTPIAYTPGSGRFVVGTGLVSNHRKLRFFSDRADGDKAEGNGTAFALVGWELANAGRLATTFVMFSGIQDSGVNVQFQPRSPSKVAIAFGVQDATGRGGAGGTLEEDMASSRSFYIVATIPVKDLAYISAGLGSKRFKEGFANASFSLGRGLKGVVEFEGYHWNYGVAFDLGSWRKLRREGAPQATMYLGFTRGKYATWSLSFGL